MNQLVFSVLIISLLASACSNVEEKQAEQSDITINKEVTPVLQDTLTETSQIIEDDDVEEYMSRFDHIDRVKGLLEEWNEAINDNTVEVLYIYYAANVQYYKEKMTVRKCLNSKEEWLNEHEGYFQYVDNVSFYYPTMSYQDSILIIEFDKYCIYQQDTSVVTGYLEVSRMEDKWKITKESDIITEFNLALENSGVELTDGEYEFSREYWQDTRDDKVLAHDMVSYQNQLTIHKNGNEISGSIARYSGSLRHWMHWDVLKGSLYDGTIELMVYMVPEDYEDWETDTIDLDTLRYKVMDQKTLVDLTDYLGTKGMVYN